MNINDTLTSVGAVVSACGSRTTCVPPPTDTDEDFLVECTPLQLAAVLQVLEDAGYNQDVGEHIDDYDGDDLGELFNSFRKGDTNYIVTWDAGFAERHRRATKLCKYLNLLDKKHRIAVFQVVLYEVICEHE